MSEADLLIASWASAAAPPPALTVSEWAEAKRVLPETSGAQGGHWRNAAAPYLVGVMDALHEPGVKTIAVEKGAQLGGPLALDTPIPTVGGWVTMGSIQPGETVFDEAGRPCLVTAVSEVFTGRPCYQIEFSDGASVVADAAHPWFIQSETSLAMEPGRTGRPRGKAWRGGTTAGILTTAQIAAMVKWRGRNRYAIPLCKPLALPEADLPVDPYVLGVWLGDGNTYAAQVTQHESDAPELVEHLLASGCQAEILKGKTSQPGSVVIALGRFVQDRETCIRGHAMAVVGVTKQGYCAECHRQQSKKTQYGRAMDPVTRPRDSLALRLSGLGLLRTGSRQTTENQKHIPRAYLRASTAQRFALLQGLMDTDGTCSLLGHCQFSSTNKALADGAEELLLSLGLKPRRTFYRGLVKRGPNGRDYTCADGWKLDFLAYRETPVFRLSRKLRRQVSHVGRKPSETERRRIVAVTPVPSVPVRCISVNSPSHLYLAGRRMVPTHNSEVLNNVLGYFIEYQPCPILYVLPTFGDVEEWSKQRLADMIRRTPALAAVVRDKRQPRGSHEAESTLGLKIFPGGYLALGGANTPNTFARRAVRVAIGDDCDRFPPVVGEEGDPADLLEKRTTTFYDSLVLFVSTPTLKGGRIDTLFARSDQRRYVVACPHCGHEDWITWNDPNHFRVTFEGDDPATARLACPDAEHGGCGALMTEPERRQMIATAAKRKDKGWRPTATPKQAGLVGFHVPGMVSTLGITLEGLVGEWQTARAKGKESLKVFINTRLAEGWEDRTARQSPDPLYARREAYGEDIEVPAAAAALTAGVDVQENRFEVLVTAWGPAEERWVVDRRQVPGRPERDAEAWSALLQALTRKYRHASGHQLPIHATCIDSGFAAEQVYSFVLAHQARRIYATKGFAGRSGEPIVGKPTEKRHGKSPLPVRLWPINVDDAKANVYGSLALAAPGPGYIHFPLDVDEEFFAQLCAEHKETRYNAGGVATHVVWVQDRERNEVLDMSVLCLAAFRLLRPNLLQMLEVLATTPVPGLVSAPARAPSPVPVQSRPEDSGRRVSRSSYLGR